jgi:hypothetical protein
MIKTFVAVLALVALVAAQNIPIVLVANGATQTGTFTPVALGEEDYSVQVYSVWLNENTTSLSIEYQDTSASSCSYDIFVSGQQIPCGDEWSVASDDFYPCRETYSPGTIYSTLSSAVLYPDYYSDYFYVTLGSWVYISVTRDSFYSDDLCTYTLKAVSTAECAAGSIAEFDYSTPACYPLTTHTGTSFTAMPTTPDSTAYSFHRFMVPFGGAYFTIKGNLTVDTASSYPYVNVQYGYAPGSSDYFATFSSSYESSSNYLFDEVVYLPKAGYVYLGFYDAQITGGMVMIDTRICPEGMGGWNCTYMVYNATAMPNFQQTLMITNPATSISGAPFSSDAFAYVVATVTTPMLTTFANYTFTVGTGGSSTSSYVYFTKDQWGDSTSNVYINSDRYQSLSGLGDMVNIALTPADLAIPGTFVMSVQNYGAYGSTLNVTVGASASSATSATGQTTSVPTTGDVSTTGSGASTVSACIAMIVLCFTALFF